MKKRLLYAISAVVFMAALGINIMNSNSSENSNVSLLVTIQSASADTEGTDVTGVICNCRPFWHETCKSRSGGSCCASGDNCSAGDANC